MPGPSVVCEACGHAMSAHDKKGVCRICKGEGGPCRE